MRQAVSAYEAQLQVADANIKAVNRKRAKALVATLNARLAAITHWNQLGAKARMLLSNEFETLRTLTETQSSDSERVICTRQRRSGTNLTQTVCLTAVQRETTQALSRAATKALQDMPQASRVGE